MTSQHTKSLGLEKEAAVGPGWTLAVSTEMPVLEGLAWTGNGTHRVVN